MENLLIKPIVSSVVSAIVKDTYEEIKSIIKKYIERTTLDFTENDLKNNIIEEVIKTSNWAYDDLFKNHNNHSDINSRYVHLDLLLEPRKEHFNISQMTRKRPLKEIILENNSNIVILGQPGSGKTTSIKYIINSILREPDFLKDVYSVPIVIRLRELNKSNSILNESQNGGIFEKLSQIFDLKFNIRYIIQNDTVVGKKKIPGINTTKEDNEKLKKLINSKIIPRILDSQRILLILDGFDEIIDENIKQLVISEIKELTTSLNNVNFILTSRSPDYKLLLEKTAVYEISELNESQIQEFSDKWFEDKNLSKKFLTELYIKTPYKDFYSRPLLLTQLASIYSRTNEIPDKPKMIYQRIVELVLKEWNEQQGIKRKTKYSSFTVERKREFLSHMAFNLTIKYNKKVFNQKDLYLIYKDINSKFKELPANEAEDVIEEIETHNGLIIKSGYDNFEFSHLTIQEYFVADYIIRAGNINRFKYSDLLKIPNELAITVALSSEPSIFLYDLLVNIMFKENIDPDFFTKFFNRIRLEKPDFESNAILIIALLAVYTTICKKIMGIPKSGYISSFDATRLSNLTANRSNLEELIISIFGKDISTFIEKFYVIDNKPIKHSLLSLICFRKLKTTEDILGNYEFPKYLYWADK